MTRSLQESVDKAGLVCDAMWLQPDDACTFKSHVFLETRGWLLRKPRNQSNYKPGLLCHVFPFVSICMFSPDLSHRRRRRLPDLGGRPCFSDNPATGSVPQHLHRAGDTRPRCRLRHCECGVVYSGCLGFFFPLEVICSGWGCVVVSFTGRGVRRSPCWRKTLRRIERSVAGREVASGAFRPQNGPRVAYCTTLLERLNGNGLRPTIPQS